MMLSVASYQPSIATSLASENTVQVSIENMEVFVVFQDDQSATVRQYLVYKFSGEGSKDLEVLPISYKVITPVFPGLPGMRHETPLLMKDVQMSILTANYSSQKSFLNGSWREIVLSLPQSTNRAIVSLNYTLMDAVVSYPMFTCYSITVGVPEEATIERFRLQLVVQNLSIPWPSSFTRSPLLQLGTYTSYYPIRENQSAYLAEWVVNDLDYHHHPLQASLTVSPIPGLALYGVSMMAITLNLFLITILIEVLFHLFSEKRERIKLAEKKERIARVFPLRIPPRANLQLILIAFLVYHAYFIPYNLHSISSGYWTTTISWAICGIPYVLLVSYWIINLSLWTVIPLTNYVAQKERAESREITDAKVILWTRNSVSMFIVILLQLFGSMNLFWAIIATSVNLPPTLLFKKETTYTIASLLIFLMTSVLFTIQLKRLLRHEETVHGIFQTMRNRSETLFVNKDKLISECKRKNISEKMVNLAIKSLSSIERSLLERDNRLYLVRSRIHRVRPLDPPTAQVSRKYRIDKNEKLHKAFGLSMETDPDRNSLLSGK